MYYEMEIAGKTRKLQLFPVNDETSIAAFILFGDVEITEASAAKLLEKAPDFDILFTAEAKSIPLIYEMAKQTGMNDPINGRGIVLVITRGTLQRHQATSRCMSRN